MTYPDAIQFLYHLRWFGAKFGLENTFKLAQLAGNPQTHLRFIHVAGTNGKGSTCAMLESVYRTAGLRVGLFTSPHLIGFGERIQVNRLLIPQSEIVRLVAEMQAILRQGWGTVEVEGHGPGGPRPAAEPGVQPQEHPTFFEVVTVMALRYFAEQKCDLVIWETGLGGRLDATNIVTPLASVITNIQFDHQKWLGETLASIAREKAGIIKPNIPVVTGADAPAALEVIRETARRQNAPLTVVSPAQAHQPPLDGIHLPLLGEHQRMNAAVALAAVRVLLPQLPLSDHTLRSGLERLRWPGRLQLVRQPSGQKILLDGAHNIGGAETLAAALKTHFSNAKPSLVLGILRDKDWPGICEILAPLAQRVVLVPVASERTAEPHGLAEVCHRANPAARVSECASLAEALVDTAQDAFVVIAGSLYLIGEAMDLLHVSPSNGTDSPRPNERGLNEWSVNAPPRITPPAPTARLPARRRDGIQAVTFDVGGTLLAPWPSVGHVYAQVAANQGAPNLEPELLNRRFATAWRARKDFQHTRAQWAALVDETFHGLLAPPPSQTFFPELYQRFAEPEAWRVFDDVVPALEALAARGLKLGVISNWDERLRPLLHALGLDRYLQVIVVSCEVGLSKPEGAVFQRAAAALSLPPANILHVGDSLEMDQRGARAAGFQAAWLRRAASKVKPGEVRSLSEL